jgi:hypothetical protein
VALTAAKQLLTSRETAINRAQGTLTSNLRLRLTNRKAMINQPPRGD